MDNLQNCLNNRRNIFSIDSLSRLFGFLARTSAICRSLPCNCSLFSARRAQRASSAESCPKYNFTTSFVRRNHAASHLLPRTFLSCRDDWLPGRNANAVLDFPGVNQATGIADQRGEHEWIRPIAKKWDGSSKSITRYGIAIVRLASLYHTAFFCRPITDIVLYATSQIRRGTTSKSKQNCNWLAAFFFLFHRHGSVYRHDVQIKTYLLSRLAHQRDARRDHAGTRLVAFPRLCIFDRNETRFLG